MIVYVVLVGRASACSDLVDFQLDGVYSSEEKAWTAIYENHLVHFNSMISNDFIINNRFLNDGFIIEYWNWNSKNILNHTVVNFRIFKEVVK